MAPATLFTRGMHWGHDKWRPLTLVQPWCVQCRGHVTSCDLSHMHEVLLCPHPTCNLNDKAKAEEIKAQYIGGISVSTPGGGWDSSEWVHGYHHICSQPLSLGKEWAKEERRRGEYEDGSSDNKPKPLGWICKPKGQAGQSDGYQIIDALGLSSRKDTYNMLTVRMLSTLLCFISLCAYYLTGPCTAAGLLASWYQSIRKTWLYYIILYNTIELL